MSSAVDAPASNPSTEIYYARGWQRLVLSPLGLILKLWGTSLRFEVTPQTLQDLHFDREPVAVVLWHNRLFLTSEIFRRYRSHRRIYALISASRDGAWLAGFFEALGMKTIRGSSSRHGREAILQLSEVLKAGHDIGITPDGPRGPCYELKPGGVIVARRAHAPILVLGGIFEAAWSLPSWDQFKLPRPFSRVRVTSNLIHPNQLADRDAALRLLDARLEALNRDDLLCESGDVI